MQTYLFLRLQPFIIFSGIQDPLVVKIDNLLNTATPGPEFNVHAVCDTMLFDTSIPFFIYTCVKSKKYQRKAYTWFNFI